MRILASVVIPVFNKAPTIKACLQSALNQKLDKDFEVIVIDDGSIDGSWGIIDKFTDPRLICLRNSQNRGAAFCRNIGIKLAKGEFVFFLDADGVADPHWIKDGLKCFKDSGVVGVEGTNGSFDIFNELKDRKLINPFYNQDEELRLDSIHKDYPAGNIAYRKEVLTKLGGFNDSRFRNGREDSDLGVRAMAFGKIIKTEKMRVTFQKEHWSFSSLMANSKRYYYDVVFLKEHGFFKFKNGRVMHPRLFKLLLNPFAIRREFRGYRVGDLICFYLYLFRLRVTIWRASIQEGLWVF